MRYRVAVAAVLFAIAGPRAHAATPEETKGIARELVCLCGDCNRESLATCQCGFAADRRAEIGAALDGDSGGAEIIAQFVETYGSIVLATPPPKGYNLLAWIIPFALMLLAAAFLRSVLVRWKRGKAAHALPFPPPDHSARDRDDVVQQRLREELRDFD